jgi:hypothetical protein
MEGGQKNPKNYEDDCHSDNYWHESVWCLYLAHSADIAVGRPEQQAGEWYSRIRLKANATLSPTK